MYADFQVAELQSHDHGGGVTVTTLRMGRKSLFPKLLYL